MNKLKRIFGLMIFCLMNIISFAQNNLNNNTDDTTDFMRSNGKIYVVMAVVVTIVTGLFIYLINIDRKIKKMEK